MIRERAAQQRTSHTRDAPHGANQAERQRALAQRQRVAQHDDGAAEQAGGAHAGDGAADDEGRARRRDGADQAADLEDEDGEQVDVLDGEVAQQLAVQRLQRGRGQQVRGAVPADVLGRGELRGDGAEGGRDDGLVQGDEEDGEAEADDDEEAREAGRVADVGVGGSDVVRCGEGRIGSAFSRVEFRVGAGFRT